jgi:hypothetical protein
MAATMQRERGIKDSKKRDCRSSGKALVINRQ